MTTVCYKVQRNQTIAHLEEVCKKSLAGQKLIKNANKLCKELVLCSKRLDELIALVKIRHIKKI